MDASNITNLQGLLRFAIQHTESEDAPNPSAFQELDPERKQFLENVLKYMSVDVIEEFRKAIEVLESEETSTAEKVDALNVIGEYVDNIDFANSFIKIGGSKILISSLSSTDAEIRALSAKLIAESTQNNPFGQKHFTEQNVLPKLVELITDKDEKVAVNALYAISCMVRHHEEALAAFIKIGGINCILECLKNDQPKFFVKACFLLNALSGDFSIVRDEFLKCGTFEKLTKFLEPSSGEYDVKMETILSTLDALSVSNESKITEDLRKKLQEIVEKCGEKEECQEIVEYSKSMLKK